ncbi:hypothetical protein [Zoogloea sp.]|uniref:hypothetical protein n=1 Tax=Zoogloea sp. TaxID=49181 RepID=UPI0025CD3B3F|nr:hypothetical protein [Zoogloea sp.]MCK6395147.1 hypothetical protein [Zoogloea sp.]
MAGSSHPPIQRDWLSKTLAGLVLGAVLAFALSGLFSRLNAGMPLSVRGQLAMWMVPPIWLGVLSGVYFFSSGLRAWLWLGMAAAGLAGAFYLL